MVAASRRAIGAGLLAALLGGCALHGGQSIPNASSNAARVIDQAAWRNMLARTTLPDAGCFETQYPSTAWKRVACSEAADDAIVPDTRALRPQQVGGLGGQIEAYVNPPALIQEAIGSFPLVSGVKSEYSVPYTGATPGPNTFTLQLNAEKFATAACGTQAGCLGWEQFVFGNHPPGGTTPSRIFIQDWLLGEGSATLVCPKHWIQSKKSCYHDSTTLTVPYVLIKNLGSLSMMGRADSRGDSMYLTIGTKSYALRNVQRDKTLDLADHWESVQFNVLGDGGGTKAVFNRGSTVMLQLQIATANTLVRPLCVLTSSSTAESNTMNYASIPATPEPQQFPSIVYAESNARKAGNAQCRALDPAT